MLSFFMPKEAETDVHIYAEYVRERVYGLLTLMAVNLGLLASSDKLSVRTAVLTIVTTTIGLWAASLIASHTAFRIAHDKSMPDYKLWHKIVVHRGLLLAAVPSLVALLFASFDFIDIKTALLIDVGIAIVTLTSVILQSAKTRHNTVGAAVSIAVIQAILIAGIVVLKAGSK